MTGLFLGIDKTAPRHPRAKAVYKNQEEFLTFTAEDTGIQYTDFDKKI